MPLLPPLAFVDVETTGLSPADNRIAEIGIVTVHGDRVERWTSVIDAFRHGHAPSSPRRASDAWQGAPLFRDIAGDVAARLSGRTLVAHNARFDHAFLTAEFARAGIAFDTHVVCSVMLSRKLYPDLPRHDLDSLADAHALQPVTRHRALPDADLVWQLWQAMLRHHGETALGDAIASLLTGPLLPSHLDPALIASLPSRPGAYVLHGEDRGPLLVGAAGNLRTHVTNYFRLGHATPRALEYSHRITDITWRVTSGMLGAQLHALTLAKVHGARRPSSALTWCFTPEATPAVAIAPIDECGESFGAFATERKAHNALVRFATRHRLCHGLLGIRDQPDSACLACPVDGTGCSCVSQMQRKKQLVRVFGALRPQRLRQWPFAGPIAIRERADLHVVDRWRFLGTARDDGDVHELLESRDEPFDERTYRLLARALPRCDVLDMSTRSDARKRDATSGSPGRAS